MKVDIIIYFEKGYPVKEYVVKNEIMAEAQFDELCEEILQEDWDEFKNTIDYGFKYDEVNRYLKSMGKEILWLNQVKVNKYKN